jgi:Peroxidase, family 2
MSIISCSYNMCNQFLFHFQEMSLNPLSEPLESISILTMPSPHDGKAITSAMFTKSIIDVYNIDPIFARILGSGAVSTIGHVNPLLLATTQANASIDLAGLNEHDQIEHDASLTRNDFAQGDNHSLQPALLAALLADSPTDALTPASLARSRVRREAESQTAGAKTNMTTKTLNLAYGEAALLLQTFACPAPAAVAGSAAPPAAAEIKAPKAFVREWFADERLPSGWVKPATPISLQTTGVLSAKIRELAAGIRGGAAPTASSPAAAAAAAGIAGAVSGLAGLLGGLKRLIGW